MQAHFTQEMCKNPPNHSGDVAAMHNQSTTFYGFISGSSFDLLNMRPLQCWFMSQRVYPVRDLSQVLTITAWCGETLLFWLNPLNLFTGVQMGPITVRVVIKTNASLYGWGVLSARVEQ